MAEMARSQGAQSKVRSSIEALETNSALIFAVLAAVTLLGLGLRLYKLGEWSFWIDEIYTLNRIAEGDFTITTPVARWLIALTLQFLPASHWSARLAPALVGVISIPVLFLVMRKAAGTPAALLAVLLMAVSPWHLHWSQNARFYITLMFFFAIGQFAFYYFMERNQAWQLLVAVAALLIAVNERKMSLLFIPAMAVYFLALYLGKFEKPAGWNRRNFGYMLTGLVLVGGIQLFLSAVLGRTSLVADFQQNFLGHQHNPVRVLLSVVYDVGLPVFILALFGGLLLIARKNRLGLFLFCTAFVPLAAVVAVSPFTQTFSRYVFFTLPSFLLLAALALWEIFTLLQRNARWLAWGVLALVLIDSASQDFLYFSFQNGNREDWKNAFALVESQKQPDDVVVTSRQELGAYYLAEPVVASQTIDLEEISGSGQRTWFVIDNRSLVSPRLTRWLEANAELVQVFDVVLPGKVMLMRVYLYPPGSR